MEKNNGNVAVATEEKTQEQELVQLREACNKLYQENMQMKEVWVLNRANFLFKVIENDFFNQEFKEKAAKELELYLYPNKEENNEAGQ
jgi:hypothetical protein